MSKQDIQLPQFSEERMALLERLSDACGVSGNEKEVRMIVREELKPYADEMKTDAMGNLIAIKRSAAERPVKVIIAAHMDEVGFMLVDKDEEGIFRFRIVGGVDVRTIVGKPVQVGSEHIPGVIGACPIHLSTNDDLARKLDIDALRIDVGLAENRVKPADYAAFTTKFQRMGDSICGKALDNRIGTAILIELVKNCPAHVELTAAFTVQEELGLRGALVAAYDRHPDFAFAIDSTPANDLPSYDGSENTEYKTRVGFGPAIYTADGRTMNDPRLVRFLLQTGEKYAIPCQLRQPAPGGTDAGALHLTQNGIPAVSMSVPGRYAHTAASIARVADLEHHFQLMMMALNDIDLSLLDEAR